MSDGNATCTADGTKTAKCDRCEVTDTVIDIDSALGHSCSTEWSQDEATHWKECECGDKVNEAAHTYGEWIETKAPTTSETGIKERTCTECGRKQTEELPKLAVPPTGDSIIGWTAVVVVCVAAAVVYGKKRRNRKKRI